MNAKKQVLVLVSGVLIFFASCKKGVEVTSEDQPAVNTVISSDVTAPNDVVETSPAIHTPITTYVNANCAGYYQSLPSRYNLTTKKYPLILFIHGIGELGTGVTRLNCCGLPRQLNLKVFPPSFLVNGVRYSYIVVSPQFKVRPTAADIQSVIDMAKEEI